MNELLSNFGKAVGMIGRNIRTSFKYFVDADTVFKIHRIEDDKFINDKAKEIAIRAYVKEYRLNLRKENKGNE